MEDKKTNKVIKSKKRKIKKKKLNEICNECSKSITKKRCFCNKLEYYNKNIENINKIQKWIKKVCCTASGSSGTPGDSRYSMTDYSLFKLLNNKQKLNSKKNKFEYLLNQFGTKEPCNRFDVGNCIEYILCELLRDIGLEVIELPNAKRIDLNILNYGSLSIKYSSISNITLHNSNSCINKDCTFTDTLLMTCEKIYLITKKELKKCEIDINEYLKNTGDSLKLKRSILTQLKKKKYPYIINYELKINKKKCKNRLTSKLFYEKLTEEYDNKNTKV